MINIKEIVTFIVIVMIVIFIRAYIITPIRVNGSSMDPTLLDNEILLLKKYDTNIERFDIVVLKYDDTKLIKRVVGLPGEHVKYIDNQLYINNNKVNENFIDATTTDFDLVSLGFKVIPKGYYFVMGDNRTNSTDSRIIGLVSADEILGTASFGIFPFNRFGFIE